MESIMKLASIEEMALAMDIIENTQLAVGTTFRRCTLDNVLSITSLACIKHSDRVIVAVPEVDIMASAIAFMYYPQELVAYHPVPYNASQLSAPIAKKNIENINILLSGYTYRLPCFLDMAQQDEALEKEHFDASIIGYMDVAEGSTDVPDTRFGLDIRTDYEVFAGLLNRHATALKDNGILIALCKPVWILKAWKLIQELGLQLEYESYRFYEGDERHRNVRVWLRFSKNVNGFDVEAQKKSMQLLMRDNGIDRLFAHRNNLTYPYVVLYENNPEAAVYVEQNLKNMQYFFTADTTKRLSDLCQGYTACLVTPSVALCACSLRKNVVLFEMDNRFRQKRGVKFVKYDLYTGLTKLLQNKYQHRFDTVICDPPFNMNLNKLAEDIVELIKPSKDSVVYVVFPRGRKASLVSAMKIKGLKLIESCEKLSIEYACPPKLVRMEGRDAIQLFQFQCV